MIAQIPKLDGERRRPLLRFADYTLMWFSLDGVSQDELAPRRPTSRLPSSGALRDPCPIPTRVALPPRTAADAIGKLGMAVMA